MDEVLLEKSKEEEEIEKQSVNGNTRLKKEVS
jgi:hypothetical protein